MANTTGQFFDHLVLMILENHGWQQILNTQFFKYFNQNGKIFADWHGATHPSGPNYRVLTSGQEWSGNEFDGVKRPWIGDHVLFRTFNFVGMPANRHNPQLDIGGGVPSYNMLSHFTSIVSWDPITTIDISYLGMDDQNDAHAGPLELADNNVMSAIKKFEALDSLITNKVLFVLTFDEAYGLDYSSNHIFTGFLGAGVKPNTVCPLPTNHYNFARFLYDNWDITPPPEADEKCNFYAGKNLIGL